MSDLKAYRPDIDGLRAVAVLSVVTFHAFPKYMRGGFTGVDVFFVISGFLITSIIVEGMRQGTFSFSEFYGRRIRRIFPALLLVLTSCLVFGWYGLLAIEYEQLAKHALAATVFLSNFALWSEAGYFDKTAEAKPLLHLWSLSIEEQFYLVWPALVWAAFRFRANLLLIIAALAIASFATDVAYLSTGDGVAAFYAPHARAWELLCGSLLACTALAGGSPDATNRKLLADACSIAGAVLLLVGFWAISKESNFPGFAALVPVGGAVMLIAAGPHALVNRTVLSNKVLVAIGLISYPLYLIHWPLLSFARIIEGEVPSRGYRALAVVISFLLAWLTYRVVEKPIRSRPFSWKAPALVASSTLAGLAAYAVFASEGGEDASIQHNL